MNTTEAFRIVLDALDEAAVPPELRAIGFEKGLELLIAVRAASTPEQPAAATGAGSNGRIDGDVGDGPLAAIAIKLALPPDLVHEVFSFDDGKLDIIVPTSKIDRSKSGGTKQLALLVAAGRQSAGIDVEWTGMAPIREVCTQFSRFDSNFAGNIGSMEDFFGFRGKGHSREVRLNRQGREEAASLIRKLGGTDA